MQDWLTNLLMNKLTTAQFVLSDPCLLLNVVPNIVNAVIRHVVASPDLLLFARSLNFFCQVRHLLVAAFTGSQKAFSLSNIIWSSQISCQVLACGAETIGGFFGHIDYNDRAETESIVPNNGQLVQ